jgi:hypothetical protein
MTNPVRPKVNPRSPLDAPFAGQKILKKIQKIWKIQVGAAIAKGRSPTARRHGAWSFRDAHGPIW